MYYIDIPTEKTIDDGENGCWTHVKIADTKEEAVEWIRNNIGWCDDEGRICLITEGQNA